MRSLHSFPNLILFSLHSNRNPMMILMVSKRSEWNDVRVIKYISISDQIKVNRGMTKKFWHVPKYSRPALCRTHKPPRKFFSSMPEQIIPVAQPASNQRSEEHTSELQSQSN